MCKMSFQNKKMAFSTGCVLGGAVFRSGRAEKSIFSGVLIGTVARCCKKQQQQKMPRTQQYTSSLLIPCAHGKLNVKHHRTRPKPESRERSCAGEKIEHQNVNKRHRSSASTYTSEADFHKPGIYGRVRVWANATIVLRCC